MSRTIAIGDIHGCSMALDALVEAVAPKNDDTFVMLGDYVDRGPDSFGVIQRLLDLQRRCHLVPLLGNHEQMLLLARENASDLAFWRACGGEQTINSYADRWEEFPESHRTFLEGCQLHFETETHFFVHANYIADVSLDEQPDRWLLWEHISSTLPPPHQSGKVAVVGHTPQPSGEILDMGHLVCLDTFCIGGQWLTAWEPETGHSWQVNSMGLRRTWRVKGSGVNCAKHLTGRSGN